MTASRIAPLDALRGLAALGIVVHHYWFMAPEGARPFERELSVVYEFGRFAVPLFYMLSGYIFFAVYAQPLGEGRVGGREFFWLRFARLYPLHILTLLIVAGLQLLVLRATGAFHAYPRNDLLHFVLNVVFLQYAWVDPFMGFNGPAWSLSIEAALYVVFFVFARRFGAALRPRLIIGALALALAFGRMLLPLTGPLNPFFAEGLGCFFLGGCLQAFEDRPAAVKLAAGLALLALGAALAHLTHASRLTMPFVFAGVVLMALNLPVCRRISETRVLTWLGDISYSTYLWHFPTQLVLVLVSATLVPIRFQSPWALALYIAVTLAISTLSYRYFETPARALVRRWAVPRRAPAIAAQT